MGNWAWGWICLLISIWYRINPSSDWSYTRVHIDEPIDPDVANVLRTASAYFNVAATNSPPPCVRTSKFRFVYLEKVYFPVYIYIYFDAYINIYIYIHVSIYMHMYLLGCVCFLWYFSQWLVIPFITHVTFPYVSIIYKLALNIHEHYAYMH